MHTANEAKKICLFIIAICSKKPGATGYHNRSADAIPRHVEPLGGWPFRLSGCGRGIGFFASFSIAFTSLIRLRLAKRTAVVCGRVIRDIIA